MLAAMGTPLEELICMSRSVHVCRHGLEGLWLCLNTVFCPFSLDCAFVCARELLASIQSEAGSKNHFSLIFMLISESICYLYIYQPCL